MPAADWFRRQAQNQTNPWALLQRFAYGANPLLGLGVQMYRRFGNPQTPGWWPGAPNTGDPLTGEFGGGFIGPPNPFSMQGPDLNMVTPGRQPKQSKKEWRAEAGYGRGTKDRPKGVQGGSDRIAGAVNPFIDPRSRSNLWQVPWSGRADLFTNPWEMSGWDWAQGGGLRGRRTGGGSGGLSEGVGRIIQAY